MNRCVPPPAHRFLPWLFACGVLLLPALIHAAPPAIELFLRGTPKAEPEPDADADASSKKPAPDPGLMYPVASFELRFAAPMVPAEQVGKETPDSPLVFTPPLPGSFRWTSQRSGAYTLTDPPPLGATYHAAVRDDLKNLDGQPVKVPTDLARDFHTPGLDFAAIVVNTDSGGDLPVSPRIQLLSNSAVTPAKVAPAFSFRGPDNARVAARVTAVPPDAPSGRFGRLPEGTWRAQFLDAHAASSDKPVPGQSADARNRLEVVPAMPLSVGKDWRLVAEAGVAGEDPGAKRLTPYEVILGDVKPLEFSRLTPENNGEGERKLTLDFSRSLSKELTDEAAARAVHVSPTPEHLKVAIEHGNREQITLTGDFALDREYTVTVDPGLPAQEGMTLAATPGKTAKFERRPAQLAFPEYTAQQLGSGRREYDLFALNVPEVRLRIKQVPPDQAAFAFAEYRRQYMPPGEGHNEKNRVNFDRMPGKVVRDARLPAAPTVDRAETIRLKWDELLGPGRTGVLLLEAEQTAVPKGQKRAGVQALVQVTNLGVVWQIATGDKLRAFAFSLTDAAPAAKATVRAFTADGKPVGKKPADSAVVADSTGLAALSVDPADVGWLEVVNGDDCLVVPFDNMNRPGEIGLYGFHLPASAYASDTVAEDGEGDDADTTDAAKKKAPVRRDVLLFSDRGVYKPGETAHLKAVVREWHDGAFANAATDTPVTLRAFDARGRRFFQGAVKLSAAGSFTQDLVLPKNSVGRYRAEIVFEADPADRTDSEDLAMADNGDGDESATADIPDGKICRFQVQEFQANAFEVKLARPPGPIVGESTTTLPLTAHYYMGKALSRARVVWSLKAVDTTLNPDGFEDYLFFTNEVDYRLRRQRGEMALDGEGALSDQGSLTLSPHIVLNPTVPAPRRVRVQASVTDQDQQTVTANTAYTVHSSDFYLGLRQMPDVVRAGDPLPLEVVAVNADGQPRNEPVHVHVALSHIEWRTQRVATEKGDSDYESTPHLTPVGKAEIDTVAVQRTGGHYAPAQETPPGVGNLVPNEPGEYLLEIIGQDTAGHPIATSTTIDVLGDKEAEWGYRNAWQLQLVPDKTEYRAGDKATILVQTPISGRALVSVEREGVSRSFVTELRKEHPAVEIPVIDADAPNVFVSVVLLRGTQDSSRRVKMPEYRAGYCQLNVPKTDSKLNVELHTTRPDYQPGEEVTVAVNVADEAHRSAPGVEVTLYAVDKGVLSLTGYELPAIWKSFYHPRPLDVRTGVTVTALLSEDPADMDFVGTKGEASNKGYLIGGGGEDGLRERLRQNFVACAYWNGTLVTDAEGHAEARFTAPDNLTEFQVMAIVHQGGSRDRLAAGRFGGGQGSFRINKPLMIEPALPRFGNVGDRVLLRAVVHNQSPAAGDVEVTLDLDDKAASDANGSDAAARTRRVHLDAGQSLPVEFPVVFNKTGVAKWTWRAVLTGGAPGTAAPTDAVQSTLNVDHPTPRRAEVAYLRPAGAAPDLLGRVDPAILEGEDGLIRVSVSTTRLSEINGGIDSLLHYPYGCIEQTVSSTLPWLVFKEFHDALPDINKTPEEAEEAVNRGVNRIVGMQTEDGGLAYWPAVTGRTSHPWGSAYGALGLALAREQGYFVPQTTVDKICEYLSGQLRTKDEADPANAGTHDRYHDHNETDRCLALYALAMFDKAEAAYAEKLFQIRDKLCPEDRTLLALAILKAEGDAGMVKALLAPGPREKERPETWNPFASTASLDAMRLLAWITYAPHDPSVETRLNKLLSERDAYGGWVTTQGNAWALMAMAGYAKEVEKAGKPAAGSINLAGQSRTFKLGDDHRTFVCEFPLDKLAAGKEKLTLANADAKRTLYVQARVESRPRGGAGVNSAATTGDGGYVLHRSYQIVHGDGSLGDPAKEKLKVGDRVLVGLDVQVPAPAAYVAINDPLPSVLEAINPDFQTSGAGGNAPGESDWISDYHELRETRALFFCDTLPKGQYHLQYLARVRASGTVTAPSAKVEEMYHPDRYAETAASQLTTAPLE